MTDKEVEDVADQLVGHLVDSHVSRAYRGDLREEFHQLVAVDQETRTRMWRAILERAEQRWAVEHAGAPMRPTKFNLRADLPMVLFWAACLGFTVFALCGGAS